MSGVIFNGPAGRLEGYYRHSENENANLALVLHSHTQLGGSMNHPLPKRMFDAFAERGFSVLRFNFRGAGRSQGEFDSGNGELADAASALDWLRIQNPDHEQSWIAGFSFGAWIGMQLLMRRPEIEGFVSVAPPANLYDFNFLVPCPSSGLILNGGADKLVPPKDVGRLVRHLRSRNGIEIKQQTFRDANHLFENHLDPMTQALGSYIDSRMSEAANKPAVASKPAASAKSVAPVAAY